jgi:dipeptidase D
MTENDTVSVLTSQRSAKASLKTDVSNQVKAVFLQGGATVGSSDGYPNWQPNTKSEILTLSKSLFKKMFGKDPKVVATHGGLECGLFLEKNPKLDMVSFGPTIVDAHSINERVEIESVEKWWALLVELLKEVK